jgi:hypothetical protein
MAAVRQNYEQLLLKQKREFECAKANDVRKLKALELEMTKEKEAVDRLNKQVETRMKDRKSISKKSVLPPLKARRNEKPRTPMAEQGTGQLEVRLCNVKAMLADKVK